MSCTRRTSASRAAREHRSAPHPACRPRMVVPWRPDASSPGPRGRRNPHRGAGAVVGRPRRAPTGGLVANGSLGQWRRVGRARPDPLPWRRTPRHPRACAPTWATAAACPAARAAAAAAGVLTPRGDPPRTNRRRISSATSTSPRARARVRAIAARGRRSSELPPRTPRAPQSAAHAATIRRSPSPSVCGERIAPSSQALPV
jgi:hypothetical protein